MEDLKDIDLGGVLGFLDKEYNRKAQWLLEARNAIRYLTALKEQRLESENLLEKSKQDHEAFKGSIIQEKQLLENELQRAKNVLASFRVSSANDVSSMKESRDKESYKISEEIKGLKAGLSTEQKEHALVVSRLQTERDSLTIAVADLKSERERLKQKFNL